MICIKKTVQLKKDANFAHWPVVSTYQPAIMNFP